MISKKAFLTLLFLGSFLTGCKNEDKTPIEVSTPKIEFKKEAEAFLVKPEGDTIQHLDIEIADDDYQRETGLMYRQKMEGNQGMLFIFEEEQPRGFYMKNTYIPLDLIFLNSQNKVVNIAKDAVPEDPSTIPSQAPAQYVLEVNAGLSELWNLEVGDSLILKK